MWKFKKRADIGGAKRAVGIDIGAEDLRIACLVEQAGVPMIEWTAAATLPDDTVKDGTVVRRREVAAQIRHLLRERSCQATSAALAIPVEQSVVRWIDLPPMDAAALAAATPFEARKYLPYPPEQAEILIWPLETPAEVHDATMRAILVAAPQEVLVSRAEAVELAGIRVASMEMEPFALVRALDRPNRWRGSFWRGQSQGFLQLGSAASGLYVMQDAQPRFIRSIAWGSKRLLQVVADVCNCTPEQARTLLMDPAAAVDDISGSRWSAQSDLKTSGAVVTELERLCREIERLLSYYRSLYPERSFEGALSRLILCGEAADIPGLDRYFARTLQLDVDVEHPFQTLAVAASAAPTTIITGQENAFTVACGLALGQLTQNRAEHTGGNEKHELIWRRQAA